MQLDPSPPLDLPLEVMSPRLSPHTGPPLAPDNIRATPISPCMANITWTTPRTNTTTATTDTYIFEIQLRENGVLQQWVELGRSRSPPLQVLIPSRGLNTLYKLRGRAYISSLGNGTNSAIYGPFFSYQDSDFPTVLEGEGHPLRSDAVRLSWRVEGSTCFMFDAVSVSCGSIVASEGEGNSRLVTGLEPDTRYNCRVYGAVTENNTLVDDPRIWRVAAFTIRVSTPPRGTLCVYGLKD